ncbi:MAG: choice-of-anchor J domain-containing protein [Paludibacter sp.]
MKKKKIYGLILLISGISLSACSNLDESIAIIKPIQNNTIYSETFASSLGGFISKSVTGDQVWAENSNGYVMISGYVNSVNVANEDWLISPEIDLTTVGASHLTFEHCARYFADVSNEATIWVAEGYKSDSLPKSVTWTQLKTSAFSDPGSWVFNTSGQVSLTAYAGKKIRIAFKYISTATKAGTWEMKNFSVEKGEATVDAQVMYSNSFAYGIGDFKAQSVSGAQVWTYSSAYTCMAVSGYTSSNNANEDWLISPAIDLTNVTNSYLSFDHAGRYFGTPSAEATVWVSTTDTVVSANWTQLNVMNYFSNTSFTFVNSGNLNLSTYAGKKIRIALKYTSSTSVAGNWEVRNFQIYNGFASGIDTHPFTVSQAITYQSGGIAWVEGYVVGYAWPFMTQYAYFFKPDSCSQRTNILMADTTGNIFSSKALAIQLPRGSLRNLLNLKDNHTRVGQKIRLYGTLNSALGIAGLTNVSKYVLADGTSGNSSTTSFFSETFASSLGLFTQTSVSGAQTWSFASGFGAKMSGYTTVNNANEDWLYSPELDLTTLTSAALSFDHTINKGVVGNMRTEQTLWIATNETNFTAFSQISIPTYPAGNTWTYVNSGEINLDAYAGKKIKLAFKYTCTTASSATWEIKNLLIYY